MTTQRQGYALARAELIHALTAYTGITTADGAGTRDTLIDANLIGSNDFITEKTIIIQSGPANNEDKAAISFIPGSGQINVDSAFSAQIMAGTIFRILNISTVELDVVNILTRIGTNTDPAGTTTLFAWFAKVWAGLLGAAGLCYGGTVTAAVPGASFTIASLAGLGAGKFASTTQPPYRAYVLRDASGGIGGAPEGEMAAITGYTTASGLFTPNGPPDFTVDIAVDDEVLIIHPRIAEILDTLNRAITIDTKIGVPAVDIATDIAAIEAKLDDGTTGLAALKALIDTLTGYVDTEVAAIKAQTDKLAGAAPVVGTTAAMNLFAGAAPSGETGALLVTIGANDVKNKVLSFDIDSTGITAGALITVRMYKQVNGNTRKFYSQVFLMGTDTVSCPIIQSTYGIHEAVSVEVQSNNAADTNNTLGYDYMLEVM